MTGRRTETAFVGSFARRMARHPVLLWSAFILTHLALGLLNLYGDGYPLGDVTSVYRFWADQALTQDFWVGIDSEWVYPVVAILPMLAAHVAYPIAGGIPALAPATLGAGLYASTWLALILVLDVIAFGILTGWGRRRDRFAAGWWWVAFLLALGPIALGRIDSVTVPVAIVGVVYASSHPRAAAVILTVGAWIKVWPGAIVIAMFVARRARWRVLATAIATSAGIAAVALSYGSGLNVLGFVTTQTGRGLQIEAPVSTIWMWQAWAGVPGAAVYYDQDILTWQVSGAGVSTASGLMTPLLLLVVATVAILGAIAVGRGAASDTILPPLVLALLTGMIAFQKVGSPQFISWLAVPVILGLVTHRAGRGASFRVPAGLVLALAALTHLIYPYLYGYLLGLFTPMLVALTLRNLLIFVVFAWAVGAIVRSSSWTADAAALAPPATGSTHWPFPPRRDRVDAT